MAGNLKWRLIGLVLIALGGAVAWFFGLGPIEEARAGAQRVSYDMRVFVAAPFAIVIGLFLLAFGERIGPMISGPLAGRTQTASAGQKVLVLMMLLIAGAASLGAWWWFDNEVRALGYVSG